MPYYFVKEECLLCVFNIANKKLIHKLVTAPEDKKSIFSTQSFSLQSSQKIINSQIIIFLKGIIYLQTEEAKETLDIPIPFLNKTDRTEMGLHLLTRFLGQTVKLGPGGPLNSLAGTGRNRLSQPPIFSAPAPQPESQSISSP